jgi:hypothetical protein
MQGLDAAGQQFMFGTRESREMQQLDRVSNQISNAQQRQTQASADRTGALTGMVGGLASTAGSYMTGYATMNAG